MEKIYLLIQQGCIVMRHRKHRPFDLKGGEVSWTFLDMKNLFKNVDLLEKITDDLVQGLSKDSIDVFCGVPEGGIPLSITLATKMKIPFIMPKKELTREEREKGKSLIRGGEWIQTQGKIRCAVVDDVLTKGTSCMETIEILRNEFPKTQFEISCVIAIALRSASFSLLNPIGWTYINMHAARLELVIQRKKSRLVFACDVDTWPELCDRIVEIGPYICMLKLHSDMYLKEGFNENYLKNMAFRYDFLIMEDRKLCDIGSIAKKLTDKTNTYADYLTVVPVSGKSAIEGINPNIGIFLLVGYSTKDCMLKDNQNYQKNVIDMALDNRDHVCGFICQKYVKEGFLHAMPGVSQKSANDALGQTYGTMEDKRKNGCDLFICGRDIYGKKTPQERIDTAREYQSMSFVQSRL